MTNEESISNIEMFRVLMMFDPITGEINSIDEENKANQDFYEATGMSIAALRNGVAYAHWKNDGCYITCPVCGKSFNHWNGSGDLVEYEYCPKCGQRLGECL